MELGVELELGNIKYTLGWILARFCSYVSGSRAKQSSCELLSQTYGAHVLHASFCNCMGGLAKFEMFHLSYLIISINIYQIFKKNFHKFCL